jgi:hypothetical protein
VDQCFVVVKKRSTKRHELTPINRNRKLEFLQSR